MKLEVNQVGVLISPINDHDNGIFRKIGDKVLILADRDGSYLCDVGHYQYFINKERIVPENAWASIYHHVAEDISNRIKRM